MLDTPAQFPQVGSFGLIDHEGSRLLARIVYRPADGEAVISLPERVGAGGNLSVPLADIFDGTQLTAAEAMELGVLADTLRKVSFRGPKRRAAQARHDVLRLRLIHSSILADKLRAHQARQKRARAA